MESMAMQATPTTHPPNRTQRLFSPELMLPVASQLADTLQQAFQKFWGLSPVVHLLSISTQPHYYWQMQDFYVAQKSLDTQGTRWAQLRLSEGVCQMLLDESLGTISTGFALASLGSFEVFLLEQFSRTLFMETSAPLIRRPRKKAPSPRRDPMVHFVWVLSGTPEEQTNQLLLSVPLSCLKVPTADADASERIPLHLAESALMHAHSAVTVCMGKTAARLDELQQLEPGDLVLLENSETSHWRILHPATGRWQRFAIHLNVPPHKILEPMIEESPPMTHQLTTRQSLWDNLPVEVSATFNPIRMPLKQLKEIEQGLVIEVGDLMDNRVLLEVEGHAVAWGELVILGDKFAVRIQGLPDSVASDAPTVAKPVSPSAEMSVPAPTEAEDQHPMTPVAQTTQLEAPTPEADNLDLDLDETDFDDLDDEEDWT